jgi:hypothetical protein
MTLKWQAAARAAPRPTAGPRIRPRLGIPALSCATTTSKPARGGMYDQPSVRMVVTEPPPEEPSTSLRMGRRRVRASFSR